MDNLFQLQNPARLFCGSMRMNPRVRLMSYRLGVLEIITAFRPLRRVTPESYYCLRRNRFCHRPLPERRRTEGSIAGLMVVAASRCLNPFTGLICKYSPICERKMAKMFTCALRIHDIEPSKSGQATTCCPWSPVAFAPTMGDADTERLTCLF